MSMFPERILLATDGSEGAESASRMAAALSGTLGSELHLVYAEIMPSFYYAEQVAVGLEEWDRLSGFAEREARNLVTKEEEKLKETGTEVTAIHAEVGRPDERIVALAEKIEADLILIGSRGLGGLRRALIGGVSDSVVRHAHCPILVVRKDERYEDGLPPTKILLAVDGSKESKEAARIAANLASGTGSELHITCVVPTAPERPYPHSYAMEAMVHHDAAFERAKEEVREFLDDRKGEARALGVETVLAHLGLGHPDKEVVKLAEELDAGMIVLGSRGLGGIKRALMGSVSESVVRHAHCPVLVARVGS